MLQQILTNMCVDPELLAELNEEQKQILFFKMREEQVRRWKEREARHEKEEAMQKKTKNAIGKSVSFMQGLDSDVWVWVMGEHPEDKTYDQICDEILAERAAQQAQREAVELRAKKEAELVKRFSSVLMEPEVQAWREEEKRQEQAWREEEKRQEQARQEAAAQEQKRLEEELKQREAEERRRAEEELRRLEEERKQQIYMDLREVQEERDDKHWQETLRKSKAADLRRRSMAKQAREDHRRRSVKALERGRVAAITKAFGTEKPVLPPKPKPRNLTVTSDALNPAADRKQGVHRTLSSSSREHIIRWFQGEQLPLRAGFEKDHSRIAPWFHGIISREEAEDLLADRKTGHFLVRVNERILGYVLSYRCRDAFKHFLIDATEGCYMLLGDQIRFSSLAELVEYHEGEPITMSGGEQLLHACGQKAGSVDYADLFT